MLKYGLLGLLVHQAADVHKLKADLTALFDALWPVALEEVRETVAQLEEEGLVAHEGPPGTTLPERPIHEPSDTGRETLARWLETPTDTGMDLKDELALKLAVDQLLDTHRGLSLIWAERQSLEKTLEPLYALRDSGTLDLPATLLLERAIMAREARVRWLKFCEQRLVEKQDQPTPSRAERRIYPNDQIDREGPP